MSASSKPTIRTLQAAEIEQKVDSLLDDGLTADEAVQVALLNNRRFQALFEDIGVSRAEVVESGLLSNPTLGLSLRFPEGGGLANLAAGFAQADRGSVANPGAQANRGEATRTDNTNGRPRGRAPGDRNAAFDSTSCWHSQQIEQITTDNVDLAERSATLTQSRFAAGEVGRLDVNLARANLLDVRRELLLTRRDRKLARDELAHVLGLSRSDKSWSLNGRLADDRSPQEDDGGLLLTAMSRRLDARVAALRRRSRRGGAAPAGCGGAA